MYVAVNVYVQPPPNSYLMDISEPYWRWVKMCAVLALVANKDISFS